MNAIMEKGQQFALPLFFLVTRLTTFFFIFAMVWMFFVIGLSGDGPEWTLVFLALSIVLAAFSAFAAYDHVCGWIRENVVEKFGSERYLEDRTGTPGTFIFFGFLFVYFFLTQIFLAADLDVPENYVRVTSSGEIMLPGDYISRTPLTFTSVTVGIHEEKFINKSYVVTINGTDGKPEYTVFVSLEFVLDPSSTRFQTFMIRYLEDLITLEEGFKDGFHQLVLLPLLQQRLNEVVSQDDTTALNLRYRLREALKERRSEDMILSIAVKGTRVSSLTAHNP